MKVADAAVPIVTVFGATTEADGNLQVLKEMLIYGDVYAFALFGVAVALL